MVACIAAEQRSVIIIHGVSGDEGQRRQGWRTSQEEDEHLKVESRLDGFGSDLNCKANSTSHIYKYPDTCVW